MSKESTTLSKGRFFASVSFVLIMSLATACGNASKPKEELLKEGTKLMEEKNSRGAVVYFKNALEQDPNYFEARFQLAKAYYSLANFDSAEKELQKVTRQNPSLKEARIELAKVYVQKERPDEALSEIKDLINEGSAEADALETAGLAFAARGEYETALAYVNRALAINHLPDTELTVSRIYLAMGRKDAARTHIQNVLKGDPANRNALFLLADLQLSEKDRKSAIAAYDAILKKKPDDIMASYRKGSVLLDMNSSDDALSIGERLAEKFPKNPEGYKLKGAALFQKKNYDDAITALQKGLSMGPDPLTYHFLGLSHYYKNQYEQATSQFQKSLDLAPSFPAPRLMLSMVLLRQGRLDDSINESKKVIEFDPDNALAHNVLGSAYMAKDMHEEGISELNKAIDLDPGLVDAHVKKGFYSLGQGRMKDAESQFKSAVEIAPEVLNSRILLANYYVKNRELAKAKDVLAKGLTDSKNDATLLTLRAEIFLQENRPSAAVADLEKAKALNPGLQAPYFILSTVYALSGKPDAVVTELKALLERAPQNVKALIMLASVLETRGKKDEAASYLKKAAEVGTNEAYLGLANHYSGKKDFDQAIRYMDMALAKEPDNRALIEARGKALLAAGRFEEALKSFEEMEKKSPRSGLAYIVSTYFAMKKPADALQRVQKELGKEPGNTALMAEAARIHSMMGQREKAEAVSLEIINSRPGLPVGYVSLAMAQQAAGQDKAAVETLKKAVSLAGKDPVPYLMLAALHAKMKEFGPALDMYRKAEKVSPNNPQILFQAAALHELSGNRSQAAGDYMRVLRISPNHVPALNNLAYYYANEGGNLQLAMQHASKAFVLAPRDARILDTFGFILTKKGSYDQAILMLKKAAEQYPDNPSILFHLAQAQKGKGQTAEAAANLERALGKGEFPEMSSAKKLLSELKKAVRK